MDCGRGYRNSVTHIRNDDKSSVTVAWTVPEGLEREVEFRYSVVVDFETYWTNLNGVEHFNLRRQGTRKF